ncbi:Ig-like domain-containing protein [Paenibacillus durus]|nr:Ig-like domain-containing protein [Paenibacillus durus]
MQQVWRKRRSSIFKMLMAFVLAFVSLVPSGAVFAAGLSLTSFKLNNSTTMQASADPGANVDIPLSGYFSAAFSNAVLGYGTPPNKNYTIDNRSKVKLERVVNGSRVPAEIKVEDGLMGQPLTLTFNGLAAGSQYILTLIGDHGGVKGITANNNTNSLGADIEIGFTTVGPVAPSIPSFTAATLLGNELTLRGLPNNAANLEYSYAKDGMSYGAWSDLAVTGTTATLQVVNESDNSSVTNSVYAPVTPEVSKVQVRVKANPELNTPEGESAVQTVTTTPPTPGAPSLIAAALTGTQLILKGLPEGAANLEYSLAEDGSGFGSWNTLDVPHTVSGVTYAYIDASTLSLTSGVSQVKVRAKADDAANVPSGEIASATVLLALQVETPIEEGKTYIFESGLKVQAEKLNPGVNTITVEDARPKVHPYNDDPVFPQIDGIGPVYGVLLKGPGERGTKKVTMTVPISNVIPDNMLAKSGVYDGRNQLMPNGIDENGQSEAWTYQNDTDRSKVDNRIFTFSTDDFTEAGKYHMYTELYDPQIANLPEIYPQGYVQGPDGRMAIKLQINPGEDGTGISEWNLYRDGKFIAQIGDRTSYIGLKREDFVYYDYNVEAGKVYEYKARNYDVYNNTEPIIELSHPFLAAAMTDEEITNKLKTDIESGALPFQYTDGDSRQSVTQGFLLNFRAPSDYKYDDLVNVEWTSDRPDIIRTDNVIAHVFKPLDASEVVVHLTGTVKIAGRESATKLTVPVTVKWTEEAVIGGIANFTDEDADRYREELMAAIERPEVKTIILKNRVNLNSDVSPIIDIDFKGKAVKLASYHSQPGDSLGAYTGLYFTMGDGSAIRNVVIDANGMESNAIIEAAGKGSLLDNVTLTGMENTLYGVRTSRYDSPTIRNSTFGPAKLAGVYVKQWPEISSPDGMLTIENSTFDGAGKPGYGVLVTGGKTVIRDSEIKGYRGQFVTGWNSDNEFDGYIWNYKKIRDGFMSAGVSVRERGQIEMHGNRVSDSDTGIQVWTGEQYRYQKWDNKQQQNVIIGPETVYATVHGTRVTDESTAAAAVEALQADNDTSASSKGITISNAPDMDHPVLWAQAKDTAFRILDQQPAPYAKRVPIDGSLSFSFSEDMNPATVSGDTVKLTKSGKVVPAEVAYDPAARKVTLKPKSKLGYGTTYVLTVTNAVADSEGRHLPVNYSWSFATAPLVTFLTPAVGKDISYEVGTDAELKISFAAPVKPGSLSNGADVILEQIGTASNPSGGSKRIPAGYTFSSDGTGLVLKPSKPLDGGAYYKLTVPGKVTDADKNVMGTDSSVTFYTKPAAFTDEISFTRSDVLNAPVTDKLEPGKEYLVTVKAKNMSDAILHDAAVYLIARGGKGARLEHGGEVIATKSINTGSYPGPDRYLPNFTFLIKVPEDIEGDVYVDVMMRESSSYRNKPRVLAETKHLVLGVNHEEGR